MKNKECEVLFNGKEYPCPISLAMDVVGGKWKGVILYYLKDGEKRFGELKKEMPNITEATLSSQLKQLENDRLVERTVYGSKPPVKVYYELTEVGYSICPIIESLAKWAQATLAEETLIS